MRKQKDVEKGDTRKYFRTASLLTYSWVWR